MEKDFEHDKPENWKLGFLYYNPKDSRYIVPKRFRSMGWTFNFARPASWLVMGIILAAAIYSLIFNS